MPCILLVDAIDFERFMRVFAVLTSNDDSTRRLTANVQSQLAATSSVPLTTGWPWRRSPGPVVPTNFAGLEQAFPAASAVRQLSRPVAVVPSRGVYRGPRRPQPTYRPAGDRSGVSSAPRVNLAQCQRAQRIPLRGG